PGARVSRPALRAGTSTSAVGGWVSWLVEVSRPSGRGLEASRGVGRPRRAGTSAGAWRDGDGRDRERVDLEAVGRGVAALRGHDDTVDGGVERDVRRGVGEVDDDPQCAAVEDEPGGVLVVLGVRAVETWVGEVWLLAA